MQDLVARCHAGLDVASLRAELVERLPDVLPVDAVFAASVDPATLLFTGAAVREIPSDATPRFLANEFLEDDVNKFRNLAGRRFPVDWLDRGHRRKTSARYRNIMAPLGLGDELRAAFQSGGQCWGFLCVHREDGELGFTEAEARVVGRLAGHVGDGLRHALLVGAAAVGEEEDGPGVLVLGDGPTLVATTPAGERWLWELSDTDPRAGRLPIAVEAVLARLEAVDGESQPTVRVRTRSGRWAVLHASEMGGLSDGRHVVVVVERAKPAELAPIILLAHGLTSREAEVAQLALQGKPTKVVARELRISEHTVEDHLKAIFRKVGVASRGELTATIFSDHYAR